MFDYQKKKHSSCLQIESDRNKMKIGGNRKAREFLDAQPDWNNDLPIIQKYKSQAAAKLKKKIQIQSEEGT